MAKFEVDYIDALRGLAQLTDGLGKAAEKIDGLEGKNQKIAQGLRRLLERNTEMFNKMETQLIAAGGSAETVGKMLEMASQQAVGSYQKMAQANLNATVSAKAYRGEMRGLSDLLNDTASKNSYVKWSQKTALVTDDLRNSNKYYQQALIATHSAESKLVQVRKTKLSGYNNLYTSETRQMLATKQLTKDLQLQSNQVGAYNAVLQAQISNKRRVQQEDTNHIAKLGELRRAQESLNGGTLEQIARQQSVNAGRQQAITFEENERNKLAQLRREIESLNGGMGEQVIHLQQSKAAREQEIASESKQQQKLLELKRALDSLNGGTAESITRQQEMIRQRKEQIVTDQKLISGYTALQVAKKQNATNSQREVQIQREQNRQKSEAVVTLERLRVQMHTLTGAHAAEISALQRSIAEQKRYNKLIAMSTAELFGLASAKNRMVGGLKASNQAGAMLRATMAGLQTSIGMYTSSTILAATATYAIARSLRSALEVGSEFGATMSRVEAIMSNGLGGDSAASMAAMEEQVRALGQSTMFTASQVSEGLLELGMAGLSTSQAMVALEPALQLAQIGAIGMGESADIATNIMMTFGLEAKDLTNVVNVMATAVTSSNTTISQMANAISYVGPAASTAGIGLKDITAAIETLANSGLKGSRAGTGLRRLLVSLVSPTKKGAEMLRRFDVSVQDAAGNTQDLGSILGQLHTAMEEDGISPAEKLAAVIDLVGVRASSAVATLIESMGRRGGFAAMRQGLEEVTNAAKEMQATIQDNLKADWIKVVSAFEEVKLSAMDAQEHRLREAAHRMAKMLIDLTEPVTDGSTITQLDLILARVENIARVLATAAGGYLGFKAFAVMGDMSRSAASGLATLSERLTVMTVKQNLAKTAQVSAAVATEKMALFTRGATVAAHQHATVLDRVTLAASKTSVGLSRLATGLRVLGVGAAVAGVAYALYKMWSFDPTDAVLKQQGLNDSLKESYKSLAQQIEETAQARKMAALLNQQTQMQGNLKEAEANEAKYSGLASRAKQHGLPTESFLAAANSAFLLASTLRAGLEDINSAVEDVETTSLDTTKASVVLEEKLRLVESAQRAILTAASHSNLAASEALIANAEANLERAKAEYRAAEISLENVAKKLVQIPDVLSQGSLGILDSIEEKSFELHATELEKYNTSTERYLELQGQREEVLAAIQRITENSYEEGEAGKAQAISDQRISALNKVNDLQEDIAEAALNQAEAQWALQAVEEARAKNLQEAQEAWDAYGRSEEEQLTHAQEMYEQLNNELFIRRKLQQEGGEYAVDGLREEADILKDLLAWRTSYNTLTTKRDKPTRTDNSEAREAERALKAAQSTYDTLLKQMDPLAASMKSVNERIEQLNLLVEKNVISSEDAARALVQLRLEHYELTKAQDKHLETLERLRSSYFKSPFSSSIDDLTALNRLLAEGRVEMEEYIQLKGRMDRKDAESVLSGAPSVNFRMQGANSTPFNELASTFMDQSAGLGWYQNQDSDLRGGYEDEKLGAQTSAEVQLENLRLQQEAEAISTEEHARRMLEITNEKNAKIHAANQKFDTQNTALIDSRAAYEEQMGQMVMMSMLSTAEGILGMFAATGEEATTAQKLAFVAQKAISVAMIIMNAHVAQAGAMATLPGPAGIALGAQVLALGYASAGLVTALSIGQLAGGGDSYSGNYDKGGNIPAGKWGVVGEYGPEMVHGPAYVTGRERTASKMGGGGDTFDITLAPVINIENSDSGSPGDSEESGRAIASVVQAAVMSTMRDQMRPNGMLDTWVRSTRRG